MALVAEKKPQDSATNHSTQRLAVLDGWRAISIIFVLAAHLLPLGPANWMLNDMAGRVGMALFFTLSGFLITKYFIENDSVSSFLVRRFFRIVPLAWLGLLVALPMTSATPEVWLANFFFVANLPPQHLVDMTSHYWSLGVEVQFYIGIALLYAVFGSRGLYALPLLCLAVTLHRVWSNAYADIVTWRRVDEILAGCTLALAVHHKFGDKPLIWLRIPSPLILMGLLILCSLPAAGPANYFRPYVAALLVGSTLFCNRGTLTSVLESRVFSYIAKISFALYVIHHILQYTWLGIDEDKYRKYLKRPILFAATFFLSHISTFYFEQRFIDFAKKLTKSR
jgi:peptidoglycan/LPS O-acetylase OafA/YrhL